MPKLNVGFPVLCLFAFLVGTLTYVASFLYFVLLPKKSWPQTGGGLPDPYGFVQVMGVGIILGFLILAALVGVRNSRSSTLDKKQRIGIAGEFVVALVIMFGGIAVANLIAAGLAIVGHLH